MHAPALRPRSAIEIVDTAFTIWRRNIGQMTIIGIAATVPVVLAFVVAFGTIFKGGTFNKAESIDALVPLIGIVAIVAVVWMAVVDGAMTLAAGDAYHGRNVSAATSLRGAVSKGGTLVLSNILRMLTVFLTVGVGAAVIAILSTASKGLAVILAIVLSVGALLLFARLFATTSAVLFENTGASESLSRSFVLSKDSAWRIFGVILLSYIVLVVAQFAIGMSVSVVFSMILNSPVVSAVVANLIGWVLYPFMSIALMVLYFDQRIRKEGYDLDVLSDGLPTTPSPVSPVPPPGATPGRIRLR